MSVRKNKETAGVDLNSFIDMKNIDSFLGHLLVLIICIESFVHAFVKVRQTLP